MASPLLPLSPRPTNIPDPASQVADKGKQRRELLEWPASVDPAADHWQSGSAWQTRMERVPVRGLPASGGSGGGGGGEEVSQP